MLRLAVRNIRYDRMRVRRVDYQRVFAEKLRTLAVACACQLSALERTQISDLRIIWINKVCKVTVTEERRNNVQRAEITALMFG